MSVLYLSKMNSSVYHNDVNGMLVMIVLSLNKLRYSPVVQQRENSYLFHVQKHMRMPSFKVTCTAVSDSAPHLSQMQSKANYAQRRRQTAINNVYIILKVYASIYRCHIYVAAILLQLFVFVYDLLVPLQRIIRTVWYTTCLASVM
jgi:hypothetical protein